MARSMNDDCNLSTKTKKSYSNPKLQIMVLKTGRTPGLHNADSADLMDLANDPEDFSRLCNFAERHKNRVRNDETLSYTYTPSRRQQRKRSHLLSHHPNRLYDSAPILPALIDPYSSSSDRDCKCIRTTEQVLRRRSRPLMKNDDDTARRAWLLQEKRFESSSSEDWSHRSSSRKTSFTIEKKTEDKVKKPLHKCPETRSWPDMSFWDTGGETSDEYNKRMYRIGANQKRNVFIRLFRSFRLGFASVCPCFWVNVKTAGRQRHSSIIVKRS